MGNLSDKALLLLIGGMAAEQVVGWCVSQGADPSQAQATVSQARKRITVAADYARDEQIGLAVARLNDLYAKSMADKDWRTAIQVQKELNRLLSLYAGVARSESGSDEEQAELRRQIELITSYLKPLRLIGEEYPVEEHARQAAELIRNHGFAAGLLGS